MTQGAVQCDDALAPRRVPRDSVEMEDRSSSRFRAAVTAYYPFVWRTIQRFGVHEVDAKDATQEVFLVLSQRISALAITDEKSFLFYTTLNVAASFRRKHRRRRETADDFLEYSDATAPSPEDVAEQRRARQLLDKVLEVMPDATRSLLVLCDIEQLPHVEVAAILRVPIGTLASRLRRAREAFTKLAADLNPSPPHRNSKSP